MIKLVVNDVIRQLFQLVFVNQIVPGLPDIFAHQIDRHILQSQLPEMHHALLQQGKIGMRDGRFRAGTGKLLQPQWDIFHDGFVRPAPVGKDALRIMLGRGPVNADRDAEMPPVFHNEPLHFFMPVQQSIRGKAESVTVEPGMIELVHLPLDVVADFVNQVDLQQRFPPDKIPDHRFFIEQAPVTQDIIHGGLCHRKVHPVHFVLANNIAIPAPQLAGFRHNEGDGLGAAGLPGGIRLANGHVLNALQAYPSVIRRTSCRLLYHAFGPALASRRARTNAASGAIAGAILATRRLRFRAGNQA